MNYLLRLQHGLSVCFCIVISSYSLYSQKTVSTHISPVSNSISLDKNSNDVIRCYTMEMDSIRRAQNPSLPSLEQEEFLFQKQLNKYKNGKNGKGNSEKAILLTIPVIFHIITDGAGAENIAAMYCQAQVDQLNIDFRNLAGSSHPDAADVEIEFCMAILDPSDNLLPEPGINRVTTYGDGPFNTGFIDGTIKPGTSWDPDSYMNIWVADLSGGLLGYAQFPSNSGLGGLNVNGGAANTDGVVALYSSIGSVANPFPGGAPYNLGRTLTHEVGHWLGLRHIWGDSNCGNDFCGDTPESQTSNFGCPNLTSCDGIQDMVENYMDYTNDACMDIFTADQKDRIRTVMLNSPRRILLPNSLKCGLPVPIISFVTSSGGSVNEATNCDYVDIPVDMEISLPPTDDAIVSFTLTGNTTATQGVDFDIIPNTITFLAGATNNESFIIRIYNDAILESAEIIELQIVVTTVGDAIASITAGTYSITILDANFVAANILFEDFEGGGIGSFTTQGAAGSDFFQNGSTNTASSQFWIIEPTNATQFAYSNDDACDCDKSNDRLTSPVFSLVGYTGNVFLEFDHAFSAETYETAEVQINTGGPWNTISTLTNTSANNNNTLTTPWVNGNSVDLTAYIGQANVQIRFTYDDGGQWAYGLALDNIRVYTDVPIVSNPLAGTDTQTACGTYTWIDGNTYNVSNNTATFNIVGGASNGCDSLVTLDLTINNSVSGTDTQTTCGAFTWIDGNTYTANNNTATFNIVGGSVNGCDSLVTLNLTINNSVPLIDNIGSICTNENAVLTATAQSGGVINWYSDAGLSTNVGSGTTLNLGNVTTPGEHIYYATETVGPCESTGVAYTFWTSDCPAYPCAVNLIANGDFENYLSCPDDGYSIYQDSAVTVTDWENGIMEVAVGSNLTPDYLNQNCGFFGNGTYSAPYDSPNGQGYAGILSTAPFGAPEKEMLGMMYDFNPCQEYTLQLKIIQGTTAVLSAPLSTDIVIYGGNSGGLPLLSPTVCPLDQGFEIMATIPFGSIDSIWRTFDLVFTPSGNYDCFIIGADCTNPSIGLDAVFVDDVFICVDPCANMATNIIPLSLSNASCTNDAGSASVSFTTNCYTGFDFNWLDASLATVSTDSVATGLAAGTYTVEITDSNACMLQTTVVIAPLNSSTGTDAQLACDAYTWIDGNTYNVSNNTATFNITGGAANGCDSLVTLDLTISNSVTGTDTHTACLSFTWIDGNTYNASNNTATLNIVGGAANGCDSLVTLDLTISNSSTGTDVQSACGTYSWIDGNTYTASNNTATFNIVGGAANGCDSLVTLDLTISNSVSGTDTQTTCGTYTWIDGNTYNASNNTATFNIVGGAANGCDSLVTLDLTISNSVTGTDVQSACGTYSWIDGNTYNASNNTATFNIVGGAANGCDSLVTLDLTISNSVSGTDTQTTCGTYTWIDGNTYNASNNTATFNVVGGAANGCDSLVTLDLTISNSVSGTDTQTTCGTYTWIDGNTYTGSSNTATFNVIGGAANGCDSLVTLDLTINNSTAGTDVQSACGTFTWIDGNTYNASNNTATFNIVGGGANGCDSLVTLDLTISNSAASTDTQTTCGTYSWIDGNTYNASNNTATFNIVGGAANGCDSLVTLDLTINNSTAGTDTQTTCGTYTWIDGNTYNASNNTATFNIVGGATNGCDSLVTLDLTINNAVTGTDTQVACGTYTWIDGNTYNLSNNTATFNIVGGATNGCDSLVTLDLTINNSVTGTDTQVACGTYTWVDGNTYNTSNNTATFNIVGGAANGCDSLVTLDLTINNSVTGTDTQSTCGTYTWIDGNTYTASNNAATFNIVGGAANGCDSLVTLDLTINNSAAGTDTQTACGTYTWIDGNTYTASNNTATFNIVGGATNGCDSLVTLDLTINNAVTGIDTQTACLFYTWIDGNTYTASNNTATFNIVGGAANGCDSLVTLDLTISNSTSSIDVHGSCDSFTWIDGATYTTSNNTATYMLTTVAGCDSLVTLDLTIANSLTGTDTQIACDSYTWIDGTTYTISNNTATFLLTASGGCDSLVTLDLTISNSTTGIDTQIACDSYTWIDGATYTTSNNAATFMLVSGLGCDSLVTLDLTINNSTAGTDTQTACVSYIWLDGNTYTSNNNTATFNIVGGAVNGCDSLVTLDLTISNSVTGTDTQVACDTYTWIDGNTYNASNNTATFNIVGGAANGCDSLVTLDLTISNSVTGTDVQSACGTYTWIDGNTYNASNNTATFNIVGGAANGCDSLVTLDLTINNSVSGTDTQTTCGTYTWIDGNTYTGSSNTTTYNIVGGAANGCDSLVTLDLTISNSVAGTDTQIACDSITWIDGNTYTASNNTATFTIPSGAANGCDSIVTLDLTINASTTTILSETFDAANIVGANGPVLYGNGGSDFNSAYALSGTFFGWFNVQNGVSDVDIYDRNVTGLTVGCTVTASAWMRMSYNAPSVTISLIDDNGMVMTTTTLTLTTTWQLITLTAPVSTTGLNYLVHYNSTGGNGLDVIMEDLLITQSCGIIADIAAVSDQCLIGNSFSFDGSASSAAAGITSYSWDFGDTSAGTGINPTHSYSAVGSYNVTLTITDGICTDDTTITLNVHQNPLADAPSDVIACNGHILPALSAGNYFTLSNGNGIPLFTGNNITSSQTIYVYAESGTIPNCIDENSFNVTINNAVNGTDMQSACGSFTWIDGNTYTANNNTATFNIVGGAVNGCDSLISLDLTINNSVTGTDTQMACGTYTWIDGNTYNTSNNTATFNIVGGAVNGCDSLISLDLTINNSVTGTDTQTTCLSFTWIDGNTYTASNNTATFNIVGGAANGCDSLVALDLTISNTVTGTDTQSACGSFTWIDGITYNASNNTATFNIVGGADNGCDSLVTLDLTINNSITGTDTQSACGTYTWIDGNTYTASNNTAIFNIVGGAANGCDSLVTLDLTISNSVTGTDVQSACGTFTWIDGNTYNASNNTATFNIVAGAANGCDSLVTLNLTISILTIDSLVSTDPSCNGSCDGYIVAYVSGGTAPYSYQWTDGGGNPIGTDNDTLSNLCPDTYNVQITDGSGCPAFSGASTITDPAPIIITISDPGVTCAGDQIILLASGASTYVWSNGIPNGTSMVVIEGTSVYSVTGTDIYGCTGVQQISITGSPLPEISFNTTNPVCIGDNSGIVEAIINYGTPPYYFAWDNGGVTEIINNVNAGFYSLTVTDYNNCEASSVATLIDPIQPCYEIPEVLFFAPNTFTPGGDEHNQTWFVVAEGISEQNFKLVIYNRWGELIWESYDIKVGWDGTYNNRKIMDGTFIWKVEYQEIDSSEKKTRIGHLNLIR